MASSTAARTSLSFLNNWFPGLALPRRGHVWTGSYDGTYARRLLYYVRLIVEGHHVAFVRCIATDRTTVLLGRNVLNRFLVVVDGKNLRFELTA